MNEMRNLNENVLARFRSLRRWTLLTMLSFGSRVNVKILICVENSFLILIAMRRSSSSFEERFTAKGEKNRSDIFFFSGFDNVRLAKPIPIIFAIISWKYFQLLRSSSLRDCKTFSAKLWSCQKGHWNRGASSSENRSCAFKFHHD